jgi:hypothetical protein
LGERRHGKIVRSGPGNGGTLEHAQSMAAHESPRTTKLYDRTKERLTQDDYRAVRSPLMRPRRGP